PAPETPAGQIASETADHVGPERLPEDDLVAPLEARCLDEKGTPDPEEIPESDLLLDFHVVVEVQSGVVGHPREEAFRKDPAQLSGSVRPAPLGVGRVPGPPGVAEQVRRLRVGPLVFTEDHGDKTVDGGRREWAE